LQVAGLPKAVRPLAHDYMRMTVWARNGVWDRVFAQLEPEQIVRIRIEAFSLDSTSEKVHRMGPAL
jgi:hypothetical protein